MSDSQNSIRRWAADIRSVYQKSVEASIAVGQLLLEAKGSLGYGHFQGLFAHLPFNARMGQLYMSVASHPVLRNPKHVSLLPLSIATLAILSQVDPVQLEWALADGRVHPRLRRDDAKTLFGAVPALPVWSLAEAENRLRLAINSELRHAPQERNALTTLLRQLADEMENGADQEDVECAVDELEIRDAEPGGFKVFEDGQVVAAAKSTYPDWYKQLTHAIDGASALRRGQIEERLRDLRAGVLPTKRTVRSHTAVAWGIRGEAQRAGYRIGRSLLVNAERRTCHNA